MMSILRRYWTFLLILVLPLAVLYLVQDAPRAMLTKEMPAGLKAHCFVRGFEKYDEKGQLDQPAKPDGECKKAAPPGKKNQSDTGQSGSSNLPPGANDGSGSPKTKADKRDNARTITQFKAVELKARAEFGIASGIMQAIALGALFFAIFRLASSWLALRRGTPKTPRPTLAGDTVIVIVSGLAAAAIAIVLASNDTYSESFDNNFLKETFGNTAKLLDEGTDEFSKRTGAAFRNAIFWNLLSTYLAGSLLLVSLATLAIPASSLGEAKDRMVSFQIIIVIGSALFALSAVANNAGLAWAVLGIDSGSGAQLIEAANVLPKLWGVASSGFLLTAIATGYYGIRSATIDAPDTGPNAGGAPKKDAAPKKDSALSLKTPDGDDFKTFGWIVQFIIALAPVWLPESLNAIVKNVQTMP